MRVLVVAATAAEIVPFVAGLRSMRDSDSRLAAYTRSGHDIDVLTTGVGMVSTAAWCSHVLARNDYDVALNLGVCGSFDRSLAPPTVVHVVTDRLPELGAEDDEAFVTIQELQLLSNDEFPFQSGRLVNAAPPVNPELTRLPAVHAITVNTVHGNERSIGAIVRRFAPQVESMEGAAFMYACLIRHLPFAQVRAVSNIVEKRNRAAWTMAAAVQNLGATGLEILDHA
jgi:futalosine hydrolase